MTTTTARRSNRYAGTCARCYQHVPAGAGETYRYDGGRWFVEHLPGGCLETEAPVTGGRHALPYDEDRAAIAHVVGYRPRHAAAPAVAAAPAEPQDAAEGYYTRNGEAFRVVKNKAGTHTYAKRLTVYGTRLSWDYAPGVGRDLAAEGLVPMTAAEAGALGLAHNRCINCLRPLGGATVSAQVSALIGYGETCASSNGWTYPQGAAAQRAFILTHKD